MVAWAHCRLEGEPNNFYRLLRVYEILLDGGQPLAQLDLSADAELDYDFRCFFLNRPRMELYRRIDARCEQMLHRGIFQVSSPPAILVKNQLQSLTAACNT